MWIYLQSARCSKAARADDLIQVLSVYQGELLPGFYDEWVLVERQPLCRRGSKP